jgi:hypothetical protein
LPLVGGLAVALVVLVPGVSFAAGTASGSAPSAVKRHAPTRLGKAQYRVVSGAHQVISGTHQTPSTVEVVRVRRISCARARRIVRRCIANRTVKAWHTSRLRFTSTLRRGRQRIEVRVVSGRPQLCLSSRAAGMSAPGLSLAPLGDEFGPYEFPLAYPRVPGGRILLYGWTTPVTSYSAKFTTWAISTVTLKGFGHNPDGQMRSFWFEYGKTRDLGSATEKQNPPTTADPIEFSAVLEHLNAKTRYFWRSAANVDEPDGTVKTVYGTLGSVVTKPYRKIDNPKRPCSSAANDRAKNPWFEVTESRAIVCTNPRVQHFTKGACFPACNNQYHGRLTCPKEFPRNLNAGKWSLTIPKLGATLSINDEVSYWRSNDSNRFSPNPFDNKNSPGGEVGPVPGWSDWDVWQWAYPFDSTSTDVEMWINCTEQWGNVVSPDALAAGQGNDTPSTAPPSEPLNLTVTKAADGGLDASWQAPSSLSATGLAGYYLSVIAWEPGKPRVFGDNWVTPVTTSALSGHITPTMISVMKATTPPNWELTVVVGAVSREGWISKPAIASLPTTAG